MSSRKNNPFLPRNIVFVSANAGMEEVIKDYWPQRWVRSIKRDGSLTFTRDPREARRFKTADEASAFCEARNVSLALNFRADKLRWTAPEDDCGFTYHGFYNGQTGNNESLHDGSVVRWESKWRSIL